MTRQRAYLVLLVAVLAACVAVSLWWFRPDGRGAPPPVQTADDSFQPSAAAAPSVDTGGAEASRVDTARKTTPDRAVETSSLVELSVVVLLPDGSVAPDAEVHWSQYGSTAVSRAAFTPPALKVSVARARWIFGARRGAGNEALEVEIDVESADHVEDPWLELRLRPALGGVKGKVVPPLGFSKLPPHLVKLEADPTPGQPQVTPDLRKELRGLREPAGAGAFEFLGRMPGRYRLVAFSTAAEVLAFSDIHIDRTVQEVDLRMADRDRADFIIARVYGPDGGPMNDLSFVFGMGSAEVISAEVFIPLQADDGSYWFPRQVPQPERRVASVGRYDIIVISQSLGKRHTAYAASDKHDVEVRFEAVAYATITVTNALNHPLLEKLCWGLRPTAGTLRYSSSRLWNLEGVATSFRVGPEQPGEYGLVHWCRTERSVVYELGLSPIKLVPGENSISIQIPPVHTLTITFDPGRKDKVSLYGPRHGRSMGFDPFDPAAGPAVVGPLPAGTYSLSDGKGSVAFEVPGTAGIHFNPAPFDAWLITGVPTGGKAEALGLREGDIVVAIDGVEIRDANLQDAALQAAINNETTTWTILREGAHVSVTFRGPDLMRLRSGPAAERVGFTKTYRDKARR